MKDLKNHLNQRILAFIQAVFFVVSQISPAAQAATSPSTADPYKNFIPTVTVTGTATGRATTTSPVATAAGTATATKTSTSMGQTTSASKPVIPAAWPGESSPLSTPSIVSISNPIQRETRIAKSEPAETIVVTKTTPTGTGTETKTATKTELTTQPPVLKPAVETNKDTKKPVTQPVPVKKKPAPAYPFVPITWPPSIKTEAPKTVPSTPTPKAIEVVRTTQKSPSTAETQGIITSTAGTIQDQPVSIQSSPSAAPAAPAISKPSVGKASPADGLNDGPKAPVVGIFESGQKITITKNQDGSQDAMITSKDYTPYIPGPRLSSGYKITIHINADGTVTSAQKILNNYHARSYSNSDVNAVAVVGYNNFRFEPGNPPLDINEEFLAFIDGQKLIGRIYEMRASDDNVMWSDYQYKEGYWDKRYYYYGGKGVASVERHYAESDLLLSFKVEVADQLAKEPAMTEILKNIVKDAKNQEKNSRFVSLESFSGNNKDGYTVNVNLWTGRDRRYVYQGNANGQIKVTQKPLIDYDEEGRFLEERNAQGQVLRRVERTHETLTKVFEYTVWEQGKKTVEHIYVGDFSDRPLPKEWGHVDYLYDSKGVIHQELHYIWDNTVPSFIREFDAEGRVTKEHSGAGRDYILYTYGAGYSQETHYKEDGSYYGLTIRTYSNIQGADRLLQFQDKNLDAEIVKDQVLSNLFKEVVTVTTKTNNTLYLVFVEGVEKTAEGYTISANAWVDPIAGSSPDTFIYKGNKYEFHFTKDGTLNWYNVTIDDVTKRVDVNFGKPKLKISVSTSGIQLRIEGNAKAYDIYESDSVAGPWKLAISGLTGNPVGVTIWNDKSSSRFYQVKIHPDPAVQFPEGAIATVSNPNIAYSYNSGGAVLYTATSQGIEKKELFSLIGTFSLNNLYADASPDGKILVYQTDSTNFISNYFQTSIKALDGSDRQAYLGRDRGEITSIDYKNPNDIVIKTTTETIHFDSATFKEMQVALPKNTELRVRTVESGTLTDIVKYNDAKEVVSVTTYPGILTEVPKVGRGIRQVNYGKTGNMVSGEFTLGKPDQPSHGEFHLTIDANGAMTVQHRELTGGFDHFENLNPGTFDFQTLTATTNDLGVTYTWQFEEKVVDGTTLYFVRSMTSDLHNGIKYIAKYNDLGQLTL